MTINDLNIQIQNPRKPYKLSRQDYTAIHM